MVYRLQSNESNNGCLSTNGRSKNPQLFSSGGWSSVYVGIQKKQALMPVKKQTWLAGRDIFLLADHLHRLPAKGLAQIKGEFPTQRSGIEVGVPTSNDLNLKEKESLISMSNHVVNQRCNQVDQECPSQYSTLRVRILTFFFVLWINGSQGEALKGRDMIYF